MTHQPWLIDQFGEFTQRFFRLFHVPKLSGRGDATDGATQLAEKFVLGNDLFGGLDGGGLFIAHCCSSGWLVGRWGIVVDEIVGDDDRRLVVVCCSGHVFFFVCVFDVFMWSENWNLSRPNWEPIGERKRKEFKRVHIFVKIPFQIVHVLLW